MLGFFCRTSYMPLNYSESGDFIPFKFSKTGDNKMTYMCNDQRGPQKGNGHIFLYNKNTFIKSLRKRIYLLQKWCFQIVPYQSYNIWNNWNESNGFNVIRYICWNHGVGLLVYLLIPSREARGACRHPLCPSVCPSVTCSCPLPHYLKPNLI